MVHVKCQRAVRTFVLITLVVTLTNCTDADREDSQSLSDSALLSESDDSDLEQLTVDSQLVMTGRLGSQVQKTLPLVAPDGSLIREYDYYSFTPTSILYSNDYSLRDWGAPRPNPGKSITLALPTADRGAIAKRIGGGAANTLVFGSWFMIGDTAAVGVTGGLAGLYNVGNGQVTAGGLAPATAAISAGTSLRSLEAAVGGIAAEHLGQLAADEQLQDDRTAVMRQTIPDLMSKPSSALTVEVLNPLDVGQDGITYFQVSGALVNEEAALGLVCAATSATLEESCDPTSQLSFAVAMKDPVGLILYGRLPTTLGTPRGSVDCAKSDCVVVLADTQSGLAAVAASGDLAASADERAQQERQGEQTNTAGALAPTADRLGVTEDGDELYLVSVPGGGAETRLAATTCSGEPGDIDSCRIDDAVLLSPSSAGVASALVPVPTSCGEPCRIAVADVDNLSVNGSIGISD